MSIWFVSDNQEFCHEVEMVLDVEYGLDADRVTNEELRRCLKEGKIARHDMVIGIIGIDLVQSLLDLEVSVIDLHHVNGISAFRQE